jgi:hypothetical protein
VDEATKLMWQIMIVQLKKIFLESWSTHHQKNNLNPNDPKKCYIMLLCEKIILKHPHKYVMNTNSKSF